MRELSIESGKASEQVRQGRDAEEEAYRKSQIYRSRTCDNPGIRSPAVTMGIGLSNININSILVDLFKGAYKIMTTQKSPLSVSHSL